MRNRPDKQLSDEGRADYGLLTSVATVHSRRAAAAVEALLESHGIRSTTSAVWISDDTGEPRWEILVFPDAVASAYTALIDQLGT